MVSTGAVELPGVPRPARRFKLTAPTLAELDLHEASAKLLDRLLLPPAMWMTYPAGAAQLSPQQQARYSRIGLKRGMPDVWVLYQAVYGIELKSETGKLSKTQGPGFWPAPEELQSVLPPGADPWGECRTGEFLRHGKCA
jgi:hypothetical protein